MFNFVCFLLFLWKLNFSGIRIMVFVIFWMVIPNLYNVDFEYILKMMMKMMMIEYFFGHSPFLWWVLQIFHIKTCLEVEGFRIISILKYDYPEN